MKTKSKNEIAALIGRTGSEAALALRERKTFMEHRGLNARTRTRAARDKRALED